MVYLIVLYYYNQYINIDYVISYKKWREHFMMRKFYYFIQGGKLTKSYLGYLFCFFSDNEDWNLFY